MRRYVVFESSRFVRLRYIARVHEPGYMYFRCPSLPRYSATSRQGGTEEA